MKGSASYLVQFLEGSNKRFVIPVYQRNYDWKIDNCKQLFDDLVQVIKDNKQSHFFGSIVSYAHLRDEIVLIDGQQRITTISLILIAIVNALKNNAITASDPQFCERLENEYIVDKYHKDLRKVRLKLFRADCEAFDKLIYAPESDYIDSSKVTINYRYFYDRLVQKQELTPEQLFNAIYKLEIIDIVLEPHHGDDPQLIFESLNSTGLDLSEADKIRNYILMGLAPDLQEKYYDAYWNRIEKCCGNELDSFVRNYLTITTGTIPNIRNVYQAFKSYANGKKTEPLLISMLDYAQAYQQLTNCELGIKEANEIAGRLNLLDMTVAYPFLMAFIPYAKENDIYNSEIVSVLSVVETFIFRRLMCDLPTNALNKIFATLHRYIVKNLREGYTYADVMIYYLCSRKLSAALPKDDQFIKGFTTKNIYVMRSKNKAYIFERLENTNSKEKNDIVGYISKGDLSIEHIMPQTLNQAWRNALGEHCDEIHEQWLHTIVNLTLTGYNSNYSNKSFQDKKTIQNGFLQSGLRLNQYIAHFDKWTLAEMEQRKAELAKTALAVWQYPQTLFEPIKREEETFALSEDNDTGRGKKITAFTFMDTKYHVSDWAGMMWEMAKLLYAINPAILYGEANNPKNVWFQTSKISKNYDELMPGLFYCPSHSSTWNKMAILKNLFKLYQIDEDELIFSVAHTKETNEDSGDDSSRYENRKRFWLEFIEYCQENGGLFAKSAGTTDNWIAKAVSTIMGTTVVVVITKDSCRCEVYLNTGSKEKNKAIFDTLYQHKEELEQQTGPCVWERIDDKVTSRIRIDREYVYTNPEDKENIFKFFIEYSQKMHTAFTHIGELLQLK